MNFLVQSEFGMCATSKSYGKEPLHIIFESVACIVLVHFELVLYFPYNTKTKTSGWWVALTIAFSFSMSGEWDIPQHYEKYVYHATTLEP